VENLQQGKNKRIKQRLSNAHPPKTEKQQPNRTLHESQKKKYKFSPKPQRERGQGKIGNSRAEKKKTKKKQKKKKKEKTDGNVVQQQKKTEKKKRVKTPVKRGGEGEKVYHRVFNKHRRRVLVNGGSVNMREGGGFQLIERG